MFTPNDSWQTFVDACFETTKQITDFTSEDQCAAYPKARSVGDLSCEQAFTTGLQADRDGWSGQWWVWVAIHMWPQMDAALKTLLVRNVAENDPPMAAYLYQSHPGLTEEHDDILWAGFAELMPAMRRKLETGTIVRAKEGD